MVNGSTDVIHTLIDHFRATGSLVAYVSAPGWKLPITAERLQRLAGDKAVKIGRSGQPTSERPVAARSVCGIDCCQVSAHRSDSPPSSTAPALVIERAMECTTMELSAPAKKGYPSYS